MPGPRPGRRCPCAAGRACRLVARGPLVERPHVAVIMAYRKLSAPPGRNSLVKAAPPQSRPRQGRPCRAVRARAAQAVSSVDGRSRSTVARPARRASSPSRKYRPRVQADRVDEVAEARRRGQQEQRGQPDGEAPRGGGAAWPAASTPATPRWPARPPRAGRARPVPGGPERREQVTGQRALRGGLRRGEPERVGHRVLQQRRRVAKRGRRERCHQPGGGRQHTGREPGRRGARRPARRP